ncbi:restriction endonuclease subunit S [Streptomyces sp. NPDC004980]
MTTLTTLWRMAQYDNGFAFKPEHFTADGHPVVRIRQLVDPTAEFDRCNASVPMRHLIQNGDLIFSWSGSLAVRTWNRGPSWLNQHLFKVTPSHGVDKSWLRWILEYSIEKFQGLMHGSAMTHLNLDMLKEVRFTLPQLEEQRLIANFLDAETSQIDRLTNLRRRQLNAIEELHEAKYLGIIHELDADWVQLRRLGATVATGPFGTQFSADDYEVDGIPMINTAHIQDGKITPNPHHAVSEETANRLRKHRLKPGDIVIARKRHLGRAAAVKPSQAGWLCGTDSIALTVPREIAYPEFVEHLLRSRYVRSQLLKNSLAATIPNLNEGNLLELEVPHIPLSRQREFCTRLDKVDSVLAATRTAMICQVDLLTERRQALITAAVTGQFDVSTASGRNVTDGVSA